MILIAHRGNFCGNKPDKENSPAYVTEALNEGFNVEIDIWCENGVLYSGHDASQYKVTLQFLNNNNIWCHAKNHESFFTLFGKVPHVFWHELEDMIVTSCGYIWVHENCNNLFMPNTIISTKQYEKSSQPKNYFYAIYGDNLIKYK